MVAYDGVQITKLDPQTLEKEIEWFYSILRAQQESPHLCQSLEQTVV